MQSFGGKIESDKFFILRRILIFMKVIIIGDGKVGYSLAAQLSLEGNDVVIIDKNPEALRKANENLDVMCIKGNGVSAKVLFEAGIKNADVLIAVTASDEMNMVCCLAGKKLGASYTIARIRDPEYADELSILQNELELDMVINPERAAAREISRILRFPQAANVETFAKGQVEMVEIKVTENMPIAGMQIKDISGHISPSILIGAVLRGNEAIIPKGDFQINANDIIYVVGQPSNVTRFCRTIGLYVQKIKNIMIVGGGRVAYYLAKYLEDSGIKIKIVESDYDRCLALSELLPEALIIHGDGSDETLLYSESVHEMGAFVSLTGHDEENLMLALMARQAGVPKVIAKISRNNYVNLIKSLGVYSIVNPGQITTNLILMFVRGLKNALGNPITSLYRIINNQAEALEFTISEPTGFLDIPLKDLEVPQDVLIAVIVRKNKIIIPHGNDCIKLGDSVIIIAKNRLISSINDIISSEGADH